MKNPTRDAAVNPKAAEPQETYAYSLDEIQTILSLLPEPAATAFAVAAFMGLRHGEIQGSLWESYLYPAQSGMAASATRKLAGKSNSRPQSKQIRYVRCLMVNTLTCRWRPPKANRKIRTSGFITPDPFCARSFHWHQARPAESECCPGPGRSSNRRLHSKG